VFESIVIESIVIILAALSRRNCTVFPRALLVYPVDVTDGTQRYVVENNCLNSTPKRAARTMLQRSFVHHLRACG
jgi:hypothetical protein